jgi:hypothetical protein
MTLDIHEFIRRFLMHVLPHGFHRIRYYGLLTSQTRAKNIARARELLAVPLIPIDAIKAASATRRMATGRPSLSLLRYATIAAKRSRRSRRSSKRSRRSSRSRCRRLRRSRGAAYAHALFRAGR